MLYKFKLQNIENIYREIVFQFSAIKMSYKEDPWGFFNSENINWEVNR